MPDMPNKKSVRPASTEAPRRKRKTDKQPVFMQFLETSPLVAFAIFILTVAGIGALNVVGLHTTGSQVIPHQVSPVRVTASVSFDYESEIETERERQRRIDQIGPVYTINGETFETFAVHMQELLEELDALEERLSGMREDAGAAAAREMMDRFNDRTGYGIDDEDLLALIEKTDPEEREAMFDRALGILEAIHLDGIYAPDMFYEDDFPEAFTMVAVYGPDEERISGRNRRVTADARQALRDRLERLDASEDVILALRRIFREGVVPNFEYDAERTEARKARAAAATEPITTSVEEGDVIIRPGATVTEEQYEMYLAYQDRLAELGEQPFDLDKQAIHRLLLVLGILLSAVVYIRIEDRETLKSNSRLALLALLACINVALVWSVIRLSGVPAIAADTTWLPVIPYLAPTAFAPLIVAILIGQRPAIFMALLMSFFAALMFGYKVELFVVTFLSALVAIYFCQQVRVRGRVVKAACLAGLSVAAGALLLGVGALLDWMIVIRQMSAGIAIGALTGVVVVGLLPVLETLFRRITDITLLELTDSNHLLLKRMQFEAPGSYHHSLVVANLAENAADEIGANSLKCRVCALFHDVGKLVKPEYFTENQRGGFNPHIERNPSFSALIIKSHVKEGVDLAVKHKLPRVIIDVIRQHHGTTLIEYFFYQAKQQEKKESVVPAGGVASVELDKVSESTYRYDGPKPQFKESAIIFFADAVEAASRSLKKVNQQSLEELIDRLFRGRIEDDQLDECPLTMEEIARIKKSFCFTLLNMLHSRIDYPSDEKEKEKEREKGEDRVPVGTRVVDDAD